MNVDVLHARAFADNYIWLIIETDAGPDRRRCVIVDPGDEEPVLDLLAKSRLEPVAIFCTHHHGDHVGGVGELLKRFRIPVYGPARESIRTVTHPVGGGETLEFDGIGQFEVLSTPGHTGGHVCYVGGNALFCGDTLFSGGCGRLLGGTAAQLFQSLKSLSTLPPETRVFCAHEYTLSNLAFALAVEPGNRDLQAYRHHCQDLRDRQQPTLPSSIGQELAINPFLRTREPEIEQNVELHWGSSLGGELEVFTELRRWKDGFTG